jgi:hypothetical protein
MSAVRPARESVTPGAGAMGMVGWFGMTSNLHRAGSRWFALVRAAERRRRLRFGVGGECA